MPKRIQRQRTKGWRMPVGAVYVGRPTRWGNDTRIGDCLLCAYGCCEGKHVRATPKDVVREFRVIVEAMPWWYRVDELRGKDLACWCPLDQPCHADVLLELANGGIDLDAHPASPRHRDDVAATLGIAHGTMHKHAHDAFERLGVSGEIEAFVVMGWLVVPER